MNRKHPQDRGLADKVRAAILADYQQFAWQIAEATGAKKNYVNKIRSAMVQEGLVPRGKAWKNNDKPPLVIKTKEEQEESLSVLLKRYLQKCDVQSLAELSDHFDIGISRVRHIVEELIREGNTFKIKDDTVIFSSIIEKSEATTLNVQKMATGFYRFGVLGDNHLCSRYQRLDVLNSLYDLYAAEGITTVFNTGNWIDGEARFNKHDLLVYGLDKQLKYWIDHYPQREGIETHYITGDDHEGWYTQREGINVGLYAQQMAERHGRTDLKFLGHMEADVLLPAKNGNTVVRVLHPGGGSAYAISYTSQKIIESYTEAEKPHILLDGHYHKAGYNYIRGVHVIQTACTEDQTPFMRKKKLAAHLGGWIIEFSTDDQGNIIRLKKEFIPFFDNAYYSKWGYKW